MSVCAAVGSNVHGSLRAEDILKEGSLQYAGMSQFEHTKSMNQFVVDLTS